MDESLKKLYDLGMALHWLKPKDKMPIRSGWTKRPKETWEELQKTYREGMNVGVRLGSVSKVMGKYLAVIDCDIKKDAPNPELALEEMLSALKEKAPEVYHAFGPRCVSGRGNGSFHLYVLTDTPKKSGRITAGVGWEIDLMSEGRQVVLPPSVHPDSGKEYVWDSSPLEGDIPEFNSQITKALPSSNKEERQKPYTFINVKLESLGLSRETFDAITEGVGVEDRSSAVFRAMVEMIKLGCSDGEILSVFTDRDYYLGQVGYDHRKTDDPQNAAAWLSEHTLKKARRENDPRLEFDAVTDDFAVPGFGERDDSWKRQLDLYAKTGLPKPTFKNLRLILSNCLEDGTHPFKYNAFSNREMHAHDCPWGGKAEETITDHSINQVANWLSSKYRVDPGENNLNRVISYLARSNSFHPVRDYLGSLTWDGVGRLDTWLQDYLGVTEEDDRYLKIIGSKTLIGMVARVFEPGIKFDHVLILEGKQGLGKSTVPEILASPDWFTDHLPDLRDKDARLALLGNWIIELSELVSMKRTDSESMKAFMTARVDKVRAPYGQRVEDFQRQSIFIGTTNSSEYLKDQTGNRRFWPVEIHKLKRMELKKDRDMLFAEAMVRFKSGEKIWLTMEEQEVCTRHQDLRRVHSTEDEMIDAFEDFMESEGKKPEKERFNFDRFKMNILFEHGPWLRWGSQSYKYQMGGFALKKLGFENYEIHGRMFWRKKKSDPTPPPNFDDL